MSNFVETWKGIAMALGRSERWCRYMARRAGDPLPVFKVGGIVRLNSSDLEDWLVRIPVDQEEAADLLLVAAELCANAVRHASGQPGSVALRARVDEADVIIEVEDDGGHPAPLPQPTDELPMPLAERGRGLFLVRALVDELDSEVVDGKTLIRAVRRAAVANVANVAGLRPTT